MGNREEPEHESVNPAAGGEAPDAREAFARAVALHREGHLDQAEDAYLGMLREDADHADALHFLGLLRHQRGDLEAAAALMDRSIALHDGVAGWHSNLGNVLRTLKRHDEAREAYARSLALEPGDPRVHNNLASLLRLEKRYAEAEASYRRALAIEPRYLDAWQNLGNLYQVIGFREQALRAFSEAVILMPWTGANRGLQAYALRFLGRDAEAADAYRAWLAEEPENPVPRHQLSGFTGQAVPERADDTYVEKVFDLFAEDFDANLAALEYQAPALVSDFVAAACAPPDGSREVLDAGCGTGLCGPHLRPYARRLTGVDLSAAMLAKAALRNAYDALEKAELTAYLEAHEGEFDLIVSADTFCYFGRLDALIHGAHRSLRSGGWAVFTVEALERGTGTETADPGFQLNPHGRYAHLRAYVERLMVEAGFVEVALKEERLRLEMLKPVTGYLVSGKR